ncbi:MAG: hypothetical protein R3F55_06330 [Alphaproteobacteria bacterium]
MSPTGGRIAHSSSGKWRQSIMKLVGGLIGLIAGAVLAVIGIINVVQGSGASSEATEQITAMLEGAGIQVEGDDFVGAIRAKIEELRGTEGADQAMITQLETMATQLEEGMGAVGDYMTWFYIAIIGGVIAVILGFLSIKGTGMAMPGLLTLVGIALTVIAFIMASDHAISWIVAIVVAVGGVLAALGSKQSQSAA